MKENLVHFSIHKHRFDNLKIKFINIPRLKKPEFVQFKTYKCYRHVVGTPQYRHICRIVVLCLGKTKREISR